MKKKYMKRKNFSDEFYKATLAIATIQLLQAYGITNGITKKICAEIIVENYPKVAKEIYGRIKKELPEKDKKP